MKCPNCCTKTARPPTISLISQSARRETAPLRGETELELQGGRNMFYRYRDTGTHSLHLSGVNPIICWHSRDLQTKIQFISKLLWKPGLALQQSWNEYVWPAAWQWGAELQRILKGAPKMKVLSHFVMQLFLFSLTLEWFCNVPRLADCNTYNSMSQCMCLKTKNFICLHISKHHEFMRV